MGNRYTNVIIHENTYIIAHFVERKYRLFVKRIGIGTVTGNGIDCGNECFGIYNHGDSVTLTAIPTDKFEFTGWLGDFSSASGETAVVTMDGWFDKTVTAVFCNDDSIPEVIPTTTTTTTSEPIEQYVLTVYKEGEGHVQNTDATEIDCGDDCSETYNATIQAILIEPTPATGWLFVGWSGDGVGDINRIIIMDDDKEVTAHFEPDEFGLQVEIDGYGQVVSSPVGIDCFPTCFAEYIYGTTVELEAIPDVGYEFVKWEVDIDHSSPIGSVIMTEDRFVRAIFQLAEMTLTVFVIGPDMGESVESNDFFIICPEICGQDYFYGDVVNLTAIAGDDDYPFLYWSGDLEGTDPNKSIVMDSDKYVTAHFYQDPGSATDEPTNTYPGGLTTNPPSGPGGTTPLPTSDGGGNTTTSLPTPDPTFSPPTTTTTEIPTYLLRIQIQNAVGGVVIGSTQSINCSDDCTYEFSINNPQVVYLTAQPWDGYKFEYWLEDLTTTNTNESVLMDQSRYVIAVFSEIIPILTVTYDGVGYIDTNLDGISCGSIVDHPLFDDITDDICIYEYEFGQTVMLNAKPAVGYALNDITEDYLIKNIDELTASVHMDGEKLVHFIFSVTFYLLKVRNFIVEERGTIISNIAINEQDNNNNNNDSCILCRNQFPIDGPETCNCNVPAYYEVELAAEPDQNYQLTEWYLDDVHIIKVGKGTGTLYTSKQDGYLYITPDPAPGYIFCGWDGDYDQLLNENQIRVLTFDSRIIYACFSYDEKLLQINKTGDGDAYITSDPGGIYYGDINSYTFVRDSVVSIIVHLNDGCQIASVNGVFDSISDNIIYVTMSEHKTIDIELGFTCSLLILENMVQEQNGTIYSQPSGIECGELCEYCMPNDGLVELEAWPNEGYQLIAWIFEGVTIYKDGNGFGNVYVYKQDNILRLVPDPQPGYVFCGWTGDFNSVDSENIADVTIDPNNEVSCCFQIPKYNVQVNKIGDGDIYIISDPGGIYYGDINEYEFTEGITISIIINSDSSVEILSVTGDFDERDENIIYVEINEEKVINVETQYVCRELTLQNLDSDNTYGYIYSYPVGIECPTNCNHCMPSNEQVELEAIPINDSYFLSMWIFEGVTIYKEGNGFGNVYVYKQDSILQLVPDPHPGYVFCGWSGDFNSVNSENIVDITIDPNNEVSCCFNLATKNLIITKSGSGNAYIISDPGGIYCGDINEYEFLVNTVVALQIYTDEANQFIDVTGNYDSIDGNVVYVTMDEDKTIDIQINFNSFDLTVINIGEDLSGNRLISLPSGIDCGDICSSSMPSNKNIELQSVSDINQSVTTWIFENLTIELFGAERGQVYINNIDSNTITIVANTNPGFVFGGWGGDYDSIEDNIVTVLLNNEKTIQCYFRYPNKTLIVNKINTNSGDAFIFSEPGGYRSDINTNCDFVVGSIIRIVAQKDINTSKVLWSGDFTQITEDVIEVYLDVDKTIDVDFEVV